MRSALLFIFGLIAGYGAGALVGAALIALFSGNQHDKSLEAAMTAAFVTGPIGAVIGLAGAFLWLRR